MHESHEFLRCLALVLCVAAVTSVLFQKLRQPLVLGYLLAGLVVGPHVPIPLVANATIVHELSELGVILLLFSIGLEFHFRKLLDVGRTAGIIALVQVALMVWAGYLTGKAFGWTGVEALYTGALVAISSTTVIAKVFAEQKITGKLRDIVYGVLIVEDLIAIMLLALLTALSSGGGLTASSLLHTSGRLFAFLVGVLVIGLLIVPRTMRAIMKLGRTETTLVATIGICFAFSLLALNFGYSVALGAFIGGALVAEAGESRRLEHLIAPVRDMFAAIFFVSVGMLIDPRLVVENWLPVLVLSAVVVIGKLVGVTLGALMTGLSTRTSVQAGMSLAQIGEFSFIIAALGLTLGATRDFLYPVAVAVCAITSLLTPWLIRASGPVANVIDAKMPKPVQTLLALYGSWLERLRSASSKDSAWTPVRGIVRILLLDVVLLCAIAIGTSLALAPARTWVQERFGLSGRAAPWILIAAAVALASPFAVGIYRRARALGVALAAIALPQQNGAALDLAAAPRRALVVALQLAAILVTGVVVLAITQPFVNMVPGFFVLLLVLVFLGTALWRSATNLEGHVRAGAQLILEVLAKSRNESPTTVDAHALDPVNDLLRGIGEPRPFRLDEHAGAVGKTLAELNLRGATGATVLAITRSGAGVLVPTGAEVLRGGDVLALAGTTDALAAATALLSQPIAASSDTKGEEKHGDSNGS
jgi:CPA2 family monovalent cation:H+ antiporter-2